MTRRPPFSIGCASLHVRRSRLLLIPTIALAFIATGARSEDSRWIRPQTPNAPLIWGRTDGILFGLPSDGGLPGPRGLIRIGVISPNTGQPQLLNFIAIEPVVFGAGTRFSRMAFSELESSNLDPGLRGKRLWVELNSDYRGILSTMATTTKPIERLSVPILVERFTANRARVKVVASIDSDRPSELRLAVYQESDSPAIEELTLTATMGNFERLRWLFLKDRTVKSYVLFAASTGDGFFEHENYPLDEMLRIGDGDAIAFCASNEPSPSSTTNTPTKFWYYPLSRLTQYWRVPARDIEPDLRVRVNGRRVYWGRHEPVPNGVAFENFELRQRYKPGQEFIFGATATEPWDFEPAVPHLQRPSFDDHSSQEENQIR